MHFFAMILDEVLHGLIALSGIGIWTITMYLIFVPDCNDIFPHEDIAFLQTYRWAYKMDDVSKAVTASASPPNTGTVRVNHILEYSLTFFVQKMCCREKY